MCTRHLFTERHLYFKVLGNVLSVFCFNYTVWFCEPSNCSFNRHTGWNVFSSSKAETQGAHTVGQKGINCTGTWEMCVWMRKKGMQKKRRDGWRRWAARAGLLQKWYPEEQDSACPCLSISPLSLPLSTMASTSSIRTSFQTNDTRKGQQRLTFVKASFFLINSISSKCYYCLSVYLVV